jgi:serine/threonine-protein kinase
VDPLADFTQTEPMTLLFASPERLRGEPVSVACDVYSLGLILYVLVSGAWPFQQHTSFVSVAERAAGHLDVAPLAQAVTGQAARDRSVSPERLRVLLAGDIEAICAKALAHEPAARYASVADLSDDLRRYLSGMPVRARMPGLGYRLGKFVRRRAWAAAGAATLVVGLAAAALYSVGQARAADHAASRARTQNQFLTSLFTLTGTDSDSRSDMTVRDLLTLAEERVAASLGSDRAVAADVEAVLAQGFISQNAYPEAMAILERVIDSAKVLGDVAREASARAGLAYVSYVENHNAMALDQAHAALAMWTAHRERFTPEQATATLAAAAGTLAYLNPTDGTPRPFFQACLDVARRFPHEVTANRRTACLHGLAISFMNVESRYDEADALLRDVVVIQRADPTSGNTLSTSLQLLGLVNRYRGRFDDDERAQREALEILSRLQGPDSRAAVWQRAVWVTSLTGVSRIEEAYRESHTVLAAARRFYPERGSYLLWTPLFAATNAACMSARLDECDALSAEALETLGATPSDADPRLGAARGFCGLALAGRGRYAEAKPLLEGALATSAARKRIPPYTHLLEAALAEADRGRPR